MDAHATPRDLSRRAPLLRGSRLRLAALLAAVLLAAAACGGATATHSASAAAPTASSIAPSVAPESVGPSESEESEEPDEWATASPSASSPASLLSPAPTYFPGPSQSPGTLAAPSGRIWDALPATFPIYPGLEPAPQPGTPASASLAMSGDSTAALLAWYPAALTAAGFSVDPVSAPLEDGSRRLTAHDASQSGCSIDMTIGAKGTMTFVVVGYGSSCAFR